MMQKKKTRRSIFGCAIVVFSLGLMTTPVKAMASETGSSFSFCVISDPHASEEPKLDLKDYGTGAEKFLACIRAIEVMKPSEKPDFILLLGDIHPEALKPHLAELKIPIHATPGNHESDPETRALLYEMFPDDFKLQGKSSDYYSFVHKDVRFISVCDAGRGGEHIGQFCSENIRPTGQCEWLENELTCKEPRKVVFAHIPTERNGADKNMFLSRNDSRWFNALISAAQPTALFFGHLHKRTEEYQIGTTRVFQVRSCCWNFEKAPIGFLHVRMLPEGITVREVQTGEYR